MRHLIAHVPNRHRWYSGSIRPCHGRDPGSIPGRCTPFFVTPRNNDNPRPCLTVVTFFFPLTNSSRLQRVDDAFTAGHNILQECHFCLAKVALPTAKLFCLQALRITFHQPFHSCGEWRSLPTGPGPGYTRYPRVYQLFFGASRKPIRSGRQ